ncbi:hypothetical protein [Paenibacillus alginolyticus]|uniref:Uncharacterized protein n=1 Tax=Paenibacillus alginolyticus TaxID=59839 RepID=A0ABT4GIZ8_9BACL|nr:hypothetical protein [Paenibacillus alginolyticus]MCY9696163.1 hypothetical protein [Paenibacillus alginolyticus]MEC0143316.1 hypothetical protein [Paenibacillus alginolyticus]
MGVLTFISLLVIGSAFSAGFLLLFKQKTALGIFSIGLSILGYIAYVYIANKYFA